MSEAGKEPLTTAEILMMAGQVIQGLHNSNLREGWVEWAVKVVEYMGTELHLHDEQSKGYRALYAHADQLEFLLAVAAACADQMPRNEAAAAAAFVKKWRPCDAAEIDRLRAALKLIRAHPLATLADAVEVRGLADVALGEAGGEA